MRASARDPERQEAIDREASAWLVRIEEDGLDAEGERAFDRWIASDPRHGTTFDAMRETWDDIARIRAVADLAPTIAPVRPPPARQGWRWAAGMAVAATLAVVLFSVLYRVQPANQQYRTELAETRIVTLPDGSSVTIGARSSITVAYTKAERRVVLSSGEAFFDVIHDAHRPFVVDAGASLIRDLGTKFDVNRTSNAVRVAVSEGRVRVSRADAADEPAVTLSGGQGAQIAHSESASPAAAARPPAILVMPQASSGAWRDGRLVFDDVRLSDLSADVNRYYAPGITLGSPAVGDLRVTAAFKTSEIPAFIGALDAILPVRTERKPDGGFRIVDSRR